MSEALSTMKDDFSSLLADSPFTTDSLEGAIIIILCIILVYEVSQRAIKVVKWLIAVIFMFQLCHWLAFTGFNQYVPFSKFFKYDLLTAVAQCFVGTRVCDWLLYANSFMHMICNGLWHAFATKSVPGLKFGR